MPRVNILEEYRAQQLNSTGALQLVRLGENTTAIIPFTTDSDKTDIHYCDEQDIKGYVQCVKPECVLCQIGRKPERRTLIPVYLPATNEIGVLPISKSMRPSALMPQIYPVLENCREGHPVVMFIKRGGGTSSQSKLDAYLIQRMPGRA